METCQACPEFSTCVELCPTQEKFVNQDNVGYGTRGVFVQNLKMPDGFENDWLDVMNIAHGVAIPDTIIDMETMDSLSIKLPVDTIDAIELFFVEGWNMRAISRKQGVTPEAVRKRIMSAGHQIIRKLNKRRYYYCNVLPNTDILTSIQNRIARLYFRRLLSVYRIAFKLGVAPSGISKAIGRIKKLCG